MQNLNWFEYYMYLDFYNSNAILFDDAFFSCFFFKKKKKSELEISSNVVTFLIKKKVRIIADGKDDIGR